MFELIQPNICFACMHTVFVFVPLLCHTWCFILVCGWIQLGVLSTEQTKIPLHEAYCHTIQMGGVGAEALASLQDDTGHFMLLTDHRYLMDGTWNRNSNTLLLASETDLKDSPWVAMDDAIERSVKYTHYKQRNGKVGFTLFLLDEHRCYFLWTSPVANHST